MSLHCKIYRTMNLQIFFNKKSDWKWILFEDIYYDSERVVKGISRERSSCHRVSSVFQINDPLSHLCLSFSVFYSTFCLCWTFSAALTFNVPPVNTVITVFPKTPRSVASLLLLHCCSLHCITQHLTLHSAITAVTLSRSRSENEQTQKHTEIVPCEKATRKNSGVSRKRARGYRTVRFFSSTYLSFIQIFFFFVWFMRSLWNNLVLIALSFTLIKTDETSMEASNGYHTFFFVARMSSMGPRM